MADADYKPCGFQKLLGSCQTPSNNGFCSKHEKLKCVSCGAQATRLCDVGFCNDGPSGSNNLCEEPLCNNCTHIFSKTGEWHTTKRNRLLNEDIPSTD